MGVKGQTKTMTVPADSPGNTASSLASATGYERVATAPLPVTIIRPSKGWVSLNLRELWIYRELLYFLI